MCDDDARLGRLTVGLLEELGASASWVAGLEQLASGGWLAPPDLVLLDVNLGGASPGEVLAYLRRHAPSARVLLVSGYAEEDVDEQVRTAEGVLGFLMKPYGLEDLAAVLRRVASSGA